jgi:hypothetical protein
MEGTALASVAHQLQLLAAQGTFVRSTRTRLPLRMAESLWILEIVALDGVHPKTWCCALSGPGPPLEDLQLCLQVNLLQEQLVAEYSGVVDLELHFEIPLNLWQVAFLSFASHRWYGPAIHTTQLLGQELPTHPRMLRAAHSLQTAQECQLHCYWHCGQRVARGPGLPAVLGARIPALQNHPIKAMVHP